MRKKYRPKGVQVILACDWCNGAFATQMDEGRFCHPVCLMEWRDHQRHVRAKQGPPMSVSEMIEAYENNAQA